MAAFFLPNIMIPFLVCGFDQRTLSNLVKESFGSSFPDIFKKRQIGYIYQYLNDLDAKSVLLEREYIDKDYLEDYSRYYVKCFGNNGHKCARLHFFNKEISHTELEAIISDDSRVKDREDLNESYLGFIVVKPLPKTFIGKTCLKQYDRLNSSMSRRSLSREYSVDLFGLRLSVRSIAFQEQDKVVSACATTSIWSALHALQWRNHREIPACSEITTNAINHIDGSNNSFPNKELSNKQIMRALDIEGLRYHIESTVDFSVTDFLSCIKNHINSEIPLILGAQVYAVSPTKKLNLQAGHAATILGYKTNKSENAVYIHDDRLGPYARATFTELKEFDLSEEKNSALRGKWGLVLQEKDSNGNWNPPHEVLIPYSLIIPTHRKVRLPAILAKKTCDTITEIYKRFITGIFDEIQDEIPAKIRDSLKAEYSDVTFELKLDEISKIRQRIINTAFDDSEKDNLDFLKKEKAKFLTGSYARFQWVAQFKIKGKYAFQIFFDATDIPQGDVVSGILIQSKSHSDLLLSIFRKLAPLGATDNLSSHFVGSLFKFLMPSNSGYFEHLDKTYGEERAPKYLKPSETKGGIVAENDGIKRYYEPTIEKLEESFFDVEEDNNDSFRIWAISQDGCLLIGKEIDQKGHPTLTGFKPARIAGELKRKNKKWVINSKSGRYSSDYSNENELLKNAENKFKTIFKLNSEEIQSIDRNGNIL